MTLLVIIMWVLIAFAYISALLYNDCCDKIEYQERKKRLKDNWSNYYQNYQSYQNKKGGWW